MRVLANCVKLDPDELEEAVLEYLLHRGVEVHGTILDDPVVLLHTPLGLVYLSDIDDADVQGVVSLTPDDWVVTEQVGEYFVARSRSDRVVFSSTVFHSTNSHYPTLGERVDVTFTNDCQVLAVHSRESQ